MVRVFGSASCEVCKKLVQSLHKAKVAYVYVDADAPETQSLCDKHNIDHLPVVQIIDLNKRVAHRWTGLVDPKIVEAVNTLANTKNG